MKYKIVAVDFDGTLCEETFPEIGTPNYVALYTMIKFRKNGGKVILWTCRTDQYLLDAINFCYEHGLQFDAVNRNDPDHLKEWLKAHPDSSTSPKPYADMYIDDKGNTELNWTKIRKELLKWKL